VAPNTSDKTVPLTTMCSSLVRMLTISRQLRSSSVLALPFVVDCLFVLFLYMCVISYKCHFLVGLQLFLLWLARYSLHAFVRNECYSLARQLHVIHPDLLRLCLLLQTLNFHKLNLIRLICRKNKDFISL
jgi:hypothetical protein